MLEERKQPEERKRRVKQKREDRQRQRQRQQSKHDLEIISEVAEPAEEVDYEPVPNENR